MIAYTLSGIILGLTAGISPGPLLVLVIYETLNHGTKAGVKTALAPLVTDTPIIILSFLIVNQLKNFETVFAVLSIGGALYILYLAYESWISEPVEIDEKNTAKSKGLIKGFYTNMLSPHPYIFWISVGTPIIIKASKISIVASALFIIMFYIFILGSKMIIALVIGKYRDKFNNYYNVIKRVLAAVLVIFSGLFFYEGLKIFLG